MKKFLSVFLSIALTLTVLLSAASCTLVDPSEQSTPKETLDSTPVSTPESTPKSTPVSTPESTPVSTPESTPVSTPEDIPETDPKEKYKLDYIPDANTELTAEQMSTIEIALGEDVDWDKHYFGIHNGYIVFGTTNGSDTNLFRSRHNHTMMQYYGFIHALYGYRDGVMYEFDSIFGDNRIDMQSAAMIASYGILKTVGEVPIAENDLSEEERATIEAAIYARTQSPGSIYLGTYEGYSIYCAYTYALASIVISHRNGNMRWEKMGDVVAYKDGEVYDVQELINKDMISYRSVMSAFYFHKIIVIYEPMWQR